ncbi:MAG: transcriptional regulator [Firmicutes bacterium]|nr:transcriptional regulator [Bacillota bacterium]
MAAKHDLKGKTFGRWTVLDDSILTDKGERKWWCRCECGTERAVLERSLLYGGSLSCGCLRRDNVAAVNTRELTGQVFGELTVLSRAERQDRNGGVWWRCRCACGGEYEVPATLLLTGKRTHCASKVHGGHYAHTDITGQRFGRLTALFATDKRGERGSVIWHCVCDCGNEADVSYNNLMYSAMQSCGCRKREHEQSLHTYLTHVDGTSLERIRSRKVPKNSTTGTRGVYLIRGRYVAKITFQKRTFELGSFDTMEQAVEARQRAESVLFEQAAKFYERYAVLATEDPEWALANPPRIIVSQQEDKELLVQMLPEL